MHRVLNESTNSVNYTEAPRLARALEDSPLAPGRGEKQTTDAAAAANPRRPLCLL